MLTPVPYEKTVDWLESRIQALPCELIAAREAEGRILGTAIAASRDHPASATTAVDGYALSARFTEGASEYCPLPFRTIVGGKNIVSGEARPVVSGEVLPVGTDAVVSLLDTESRGDRLEIFGPVAAGENVIPAGRETRSGEALLAPGRVLRPVDVALAIELGIETIDVVRRPRVNLAVLQNDIRDASGAMVHSLISRDGGTGYRSQPTGDDFSTLADVDLLVTIGGTGFGPNDRAASMLESAGELVFRGVAINPGETAGIGLVAGKAVVLLPGAPLAAWFAYELLAGRAVRKLAGRGAALPYGTRRVTLTRKVSSGLGRLDCCRLQIRENRAEPLAVTDNRTLSTAVRADGFALVPAHSEGFPEGTEIPAYLFDPQQ